MLATNRHGGIKTASKNRELRRQLKAKLVLLGVSQREVARETGFSFGYVCHVLAGRRTNKKITEYIERIPLQEGA